MSIVSENLFIAIDGGGTQCRALFGKSNKQFLAQYAGKSANIWSDPEASYHEVIDTCSKVVESAGFSPEEIFPHLTVCAGLAGAERKSASSHFLAKAWPFKKFLLYHDTVIALEGAFDGKDGGLVILGTGISACLKTGSSYDHIGGWTFPFDDRGSGAWLGQWALRNTLRAEAGFIPMNKLASHVLNEYDHDVEKIVDFTRLATPRDFAKFAPIVWELAENGENVAVALIKTAATEVDRHFAVMQRRGAQQITLVGGMADRMYSWLSPSTKSIYAKPRQEPIYGAFSLGVKTIGDSDT